MSFIKKKIFLEKYKKVLQYMEDIITNLKEEACKENKLEIRIKAKQAYDRILYAEEREKKNMANY